jgi:hypothetical protein
LQDSRSLGKPWPTPACISFRISHAGTSETPLVAFIASESWKIAKHKVCPSALARLCYLETDLRLTQVIVLLLMSPTMSIKPFSIIVATAKDGGIGVNGNLPWRLSGDMAFFKRITVRHSWRVVQNDCTLVFS